MGVNSLASMVAGSVIGYNERDCGHTSEIASLAIPLDLNRDGYTDLVRGKLVECAGRTSDESAAYFGRGDNYHEGVPVRLFASDQDARWPGRLPRSVIVDPDVVWHRHPGDRGVQVGEAIEFGGQHVWVVGVDLPTATDPDSLSLLLQAQRCGESPSPIEWVPIAYFSDLNGVPIAVGETVAARLACARGESAAHCPDPYALPLQPDVELFANAVGRFAASQERALRVFGKIVARSGVLEMGSAEDVVLSWLPIARPYQDLHQQLNPISSDAGFLPPIEYQQREFCTEALHGSLRWSDLTHSVVATALRRISPP